jgi:hypothetical protein
MVHYTFPKLTGFLREGTDFPAPMKLSGTTLCAANDTGGDMAR